MIEEINALQHSLVFLELLVLLSSNVGKAPLL